MRIRHFLEGRWFGHPLHPLISHLPMGLWLLALILDTAAFSNAQFAWALPAAAWTLLIGTSFALLAVITGLNDWLDIRQDHPAQTPALWHMAMMMPATILFIFDTLLHFAATPAAQASGVMLGLSIAGYAMALAGGYLGGVMIYDNGIAVGRHRRAAALPQVTIYEPRKGTTEVSLAPKTDPAPEFHPVIPESALSEGATLRVQIHDTILMLTRSNGRIYATQEFCTHRCGPLSEGKIENGQVQCPWHNSRFDLSTGQSTHGPAQVPLRTYPTEIKNGIIHVDINPPAVIPPPSVIAAPPIPHPDRFIQPPPVSTPAPEDRSAERRNPEKSVAETRERAREDLRRRSTAQ